MEEPQQPTPFNSNSCPLVPAHSNTIVDESVVPSELPPPLHVPKVDEPPSGQPDLAFVQQLRDLEAGALQQIAAWGPVYLNQDCDSKPLVATLGVKRKAADLDNESDNSESDSDSEDEEDRVPPHDPATQVRPKLPIYHPGFEFTKNITQRILAIITEYITAAIRDGYNDEEAKHLRHEIIRNKDITYEKATKVAVAGDTGAGKSALLNAMLGVVNLNIESDAGGACTCVITEFRQSPPGQAAPYVAEVQFFDLAVCHPLVKELFAQWFMVRSKQRQDPDDVDDRELDQLNTAQDCLQQLFAHRLGHESVEHFMGTATSPTDAKVFNQLIKWTDAIHNTFVEEGQMSISFTSNTPEDLIEQYHPFTREVPNATFKNQPLRYSPWPLVKLVRVSFQSSPILQQNVIVADVPGTSDTNYFRVQNANMYLQSCDTTIVVGKIDRLVDNPSFREQYMDAFRRRRSGSVVLVATRSDDLNEENNTTVTMGKTTQEQLEVVSEKLADFSKKIKVLNNDIDHMRSRGDKKASKKLKKLKKKLSRRTEMLVKERKNILIDNRNRQVSLALGGNYRTNTGDDAGAPVFCVSNRMYMRHLRGFDGTIEHMIPTMTLDQTQIPAFCSHIYILPSKGKTASLNHFVAVTVPTLLSVVQMSCSTTTLARANHLTAIVQDTRNKLVTRIEQLASKLRQGDIKFLVDELSESAVQKRFEKQASKHLNRWEKLNAATHRAIVKKHGYYTQKKKNIRMNWNEDLLSSIKPIIDAAFQRVIDDSLEKFKAESMQAIKEIIRDLDDILKGITCDLTALVCDAYNVCFKNNLKSYLIEVDEHVENAITALKNTLIKVHLNTIRLGEADYFPEAMSPIYGEALSKKSPGKGITMKDARCAHLRQALTNPQGPLSDVLYWLKGDVMQAVSNASRKLGASVDEMLGKIQDHFDKMKNRKDNDTIEGKRFRTELHQLVHESRRILDGVVQQSLDLCKAYK
ncbi:hypothetical protein ACN47E_000179 [Coniothyrium glycines]